MFCRAGTGGQSGVEDGKEVAKKAAPREGRRLAETEMEAV